jgi:hypothetical protein
MGLSSCGIEAKRYGRTIKLLLDPSEEGRVSIHTFAKFVLWFRPFKDVATVSSKTFELAPFLLSSTEEEVLDAVTEGTFAIR